MDAAEHRHLFRALRRAGWTVKLDGGHYHVCDEADRLITTVSGSSSDRRARQNLHADLRRAGFEWPRQHRRQGRKAARP
jgi:hypothetical protein